MSLFVRMTRIPMLPNENSVNCKSISCMHLFFLSIEYSNRYVDAGMILNADDASENHATQFHT